MKLVVLNVAYPFTPVGPGALGSAELLLTRLDVALTQSGHESFVMACEGSVTEGILLATPKPSLSFDETERHRIHEQYRFTLQTFLEQWPIDLIHMHGADFYEYLPAPGVPLLVTLHLSLDQYPEAIFHLDRPQTFLQCVSAHQQDTCPSSLFLWPEMGPDVVGDSADTLHAARFLDAAGINKYFSIYECLVGEARALEEPAQGFSKTPFAGEVIHA